MIWAKVKGINKQHFETVPRHPQRQKGRQKIERENSRQGPCQRGREWNSGPDYSDRQLQADTVLQKEMLVKTRKKKKGGKKAGVFVEPCRTGSFEGHIMCLVSSGSKSDATSFLSRFAFPSFSPLEYSENTFHQIMCFCFSSSREEIHIQRQIILVKIELVCIYSPLYHSKWGFTALTCVLSWLRGTRPSHCTTFSRICPISLHR